MTMMTPLLWRGADKRLADLRISVLENDAPVASILRQALLTWGISGITVYDTVSSALTGVCAAPPDILFINGNGSRHSASALTRTIRDPQRFPRPFLAIVIILSDVTRSKVADARDAGADEFLVYPFSHKSLFERISSIVLDRRGFVSVAGFFGPDRRRGAMARFLGSNRRGNPTVLINPHTGELYTDAG
jgi:two-component system, chemotaxis family, chemotaxis protein CheY